jgi:hypothetical protein
MGVPWLYEFPTILARLMPSLPILISCHFRFDQISASRRMPGAPGGNLNRPSGADPTSVGVQITCSGQSPTCSRFSGPFSAPGDCTCSVGFQFVSRTEVDFSDLAHFSRTRRRPASFIDELENEPEMWKLYALKKILKTETEDRLMG